MVRFSISIYIYDWMVNNFTIGRYVYLLSADMDEMIYLRLLKSHVEEALDDAPWAVPM